MIDAKSCSPLCSAMSISLLLWLFVLLDWCLLPTCVSGWGVGRAGCHEGFSAVFLSGYLRTQRGLFSLTVLSALPMER